LKSYKKSLKVVVISVLAIIAVSSFNMFNKNVLATQNGATYNQSPKNLGIKTINNPKYKWTVEFTMPGNFNSIENNLEVRELENGVLGPKVSVKIESGNNDKLVKIIPLSRGYEFGKVYRIIVSDGAKSQSNLNIKRKVIMDFKVEDKISVIVDLEVAKVMPMFKKIRVTTNTANIAKFKIEGNNNYFDINKEAITLAQNDSKIYFYDENLELLGESNINLETTGTFNIMAK